MKTTAHMKNFWLNQNDLSIQIRRISTKAIEKFKITNKETPQYLHYLITLKKIINIFLSTAMQHIYQQSRLPGMD